MASHILYFRKQVVGSGVSHLGLQADGTPPNAGLTDTGWSVGVTASGKSSLMEAQTERPETTFDTSTKPSGSPNGELGDSYRGLVKTTGSFASGIWDFTWFVGARSASGATGKVNFQLRKGADPSGLSSLQVGGFYSTNSTIVPTGACYVTQGIANLPSFVMNNEYLFVHTAWHVTGVAPNASADVFFATGAGASIGTTDFQQ